MTSKFLKLCEVTADRDVQVRDELDEATVAEYAQAMKLGAKFPRPVVFFDRLTYWLSSGFHRYAAQASLGEFTEIECDVRTGGKRDAILFAMSDNKHGMHLTQAEKKRAIERMLQDADWSQKSDNEIARHIGASPTTVGKYRASVSSNLDSEEVTHLPETDEVDEEALRKSVQGDRPRTYPTKHGTRATMKTANIGTKTGTRRAAEGEQPTAPTARDPVLPSPIPPASTAANSAASVSPVLLDAPPDPDDEQATVPVLHAGVEQGATADEAKDIARLEKSNQQLDDYIVKCHRKIATLEGKLAAATAELAVLRRKLQASGAVEDVMLKQADGAKPPPTESAAS